MPNLHIKKRDLCCLTPPPFTQTTPTKAVMDRSTHCFFDFDCQVALNTSGFRSWAEAMLFEISSNKKMK